MANPAPKINSRTAGDIAGEVQHLLEVYTPAWKEFDPNPVTGKPEPKGVSAALIGVFSRFAEIIIERFNKVPEKNALAFLDLLGASLLPPQPARVPLTFSLAGGSVVDGIVPAGTQVAAPPAEGEKAPVIFETERELVVTAAKLRSVVTRDPKQDLYTEHVQILDPEALPKDPVFQGDRSIEHAFYLGHGSLFSHPSLQTLKIHFTLENIEDLDTRTLQWEVWDGKDGIPIQPDPRAGGDDTANLTKSGHVVFSELPAFPRRTVRSIESRWLRCRLLTPITKETAPQDGMVRAGQLPLVTAVTLEATVDRVGLGVEQAFTNLLPLDLSKDFFPFGEKPKFGDICYLANGEAFSQAGATITLHITLTNPASGETQSPPPVKPSGDLRLNWEFWANGEWISLGTSTPTVPLELPPPGFEDTTMALTETGSVSFTLPTAPEIKNIGGTENFWIRVRIITGNYGREAYYVEDLTEQAGFKFVPATFAPPVISSITVDFDLTKVEAPEAVEIYNDSVFDSSSTLFTPFQPTHDLHPSLYLGFDLPAGLKTFPNSTLSLYFRLADAVYGQEADNPSPAEPLRLAWEYWNGSEWSQLTVRDNTENLTRSGLVEFLPPQNFTHRTEFGWDRYWLRVVWESGDYEFLPKLEKLILNTTMAAQTITLLNESLGSSDGSENQRFRTTRAPVLAGQQLEVREPEQPSLEEQAIIEKEEGKDAISIKLDPTGRPREIWVRWHEVPDFYGSSARDRHYVLDHLTGEIRFGDGLHGRIPPAGTGNIRMRRYQTGGGKSGNKPAKSIVQLKTTVPYVGKVINTDPATGGADAEETGSLLERASHSLRHRERAVTVKDFEDLAKLASAEVARTLCVPLYNLAVDPDAISELRGMVSLIIVPRSTDPKPLPSQGLIERIRNYLNNHRISTAKLAIVGPEYLRVDIEAEIALVFLEGASEVRRRVLEALSSYLHPLSGGLAGKGWDFGRMPHKSDLYALIEALPGVDHIRTLKVTEIEDRPGVRETGRFLVYSGTHTINLIFPEG